MQKTCTKRDGENNLCHLIEKRVLSDITELGQRKERERERERDRERERESDHQIFYNKTIC